MIIGNQQDISEQPAMGADARGAVVGASGLGASSDHLPFLDGVRGVAAFWVLLSHALLMSGWTLPVLRQGDLAVDVFMIMSGFLMAHHYQLRQEAERWESPSTWGIFYVRRFFRIAPLYYLALAAALLLGPQLWRMRQEIAAAFPAVATPAERYLDHGLGNMLAHVTFVFGAWPRYGFATPLPDWSIGLEMQFYLAFPFLMLFLSKCSPFWGSVVLWGAGRLIQKTMPSGLFQEPSFLPLKIGLFIIGILLAVARYRRSREGKNWLALLALGVVLAGLTRSGMILGVTVGVGAILFYDANRDFLRIGWLLKWLERMLGGRVATFLADTSYSVYLTHVLIMIPIAAMLCGTSGYLGLPGFARFGSLLGLVIVPVYLVSWGLYRWVEKPGIRQGKAVIGWHRSRV